MRLRLGEVRGPERGPAANDEASARGGGRDLKRPYGEVLPSPRTGKVALQGPDEVPAKRTSRAP